eukprot:TRINITY_DN74441_c0_g1_i1.p1 TRINITY_DN74441_c0_g1~~TRINITY_DN74441_c0_g1_i1.p1  ORF type:complete len:524 (+),score=90.44 TRINITY_DN74441_c0_g1_i1:231-1574(+)
MGAIRKRVVCTEDNLSWEIARVLDDAEEEEELSDESDAEPPVETRKDKAGSTGKDPSVRSVVAGTKAGSNVKDPSVRPVVANPKRSAALSSSVAKLMAAAEFHRFSSLQCEPYGSVFEELMRSPGERKSNREKSIQRVKSLLEKVSIGRERFGGFRPMRRKARSVTPPPAQPKGRRLPTAAFESAPVARKEIAKPPLLSPCLQFSQNLLSPVVIFDWDDTLFPTWYVMEVVQPSLSAEQRCCKRLPEDSEFWEPLRKHAIRIRKTLIAAKEVAQVAIVTLAKKPWVIDSSYQFLPEFDMSALLKDLDIKVIYARDCISPCMARAADDEEGVNPFIVAKRNAMHKCVRMLRKNLGWDTANVISIGDSVVEREACKELMWNYGEEGNLCKTVKFVEDPALDLLSMELEVLSSWLQPLVTYDDDADLGFDDDPDADEILCQVLNPRARAH